jgi:cytochrome c oxidase subunit 2
MNKYYGFGLPIDISTHGGAIDILIVSIHVFMAVLFVGWMGFLIWTIIRFRQRPGHQATYKLKHFKTPTYIEVFVALFEAFLLVGFSLPIMYKYRFAMPEKKNAVEIHVMAEQFAWNIHYPGRDGQFGKTKSELISTENPIGLDKSDPNAKDDITTINQLHVPVNKPIIVKLSSKDVIHSFFLPVARVKQDVIPGQNIPVSFEVTQTGDFEIACAQLCGLGHYRMKGFFIVQTDEEFKKWLEEQAPAPETKVVAS